MTLTRQHIDSSQRLSARIDKGNGKGGNVNRLYSRGHVFFRSLCSISASVDLCQLNSVHLLGLKHGFNVSSEDVVLSFLAQNNFFWWGGVPKSLLSFCL